MLITIVLGALTLMLLGLNIVFYSKNGPQCTLGMLIAIVGLFFMLLSPVLAHDHNNPANNEWLKSLHSKNKTWCCDGNDTDAIEDWDTKGGHYRVKFQGQWFDVPDGALVDGPNKGGGALLWMSKGWGGVEVRRFMPGTLS